MAPKFFDLANESVGELGEEERVVGKLLLRLVILFPHNVHDIAVLETPDTRRWTNAANIKSLGAGVFLTAALFNHSCDPSFMRCNTGSGLVSVAARRIPAGEEISECYGQMWYTRSADTRQAALSGHYRFQCQCPACLQSWPTVKELQYATGGTTKHADLTRVRCRGCGVALERVKGHKVSSCLTCLVCGLETQVQDIPLQQIAEASQQAVGRLCGQLDWVGGLQAVREAQALFDLHLVPPSLELYNTQIAIWRAMWMIVGNKKLVKGII